MEIHKKENNFAFIDGQNLHLGTTKSGWKVDIKKFRIYLRDKYQVAEAYYFLGCIMEEEQELYNHLQKSGFIVLFREHHHVLKSEKKGNVDTDIVFEIMRNVADKTDMEKAVLVSGDGDYKKMVDYLSKRNRLRKILFPNYHFASSLYKKMGSECFDSLDNAHVRIKIEFFA